MPSRVGNTKKIRFQISVTTSKLLFLSIIILVQNYYSLSFTSLKFKNILEIQGGKKNKSNGIIENFGDNEPAKSKAVVKNERKTSSESCESVAIICEAKQMCETERDVKVL